MYYFFILQPLHQLSVEQDPGISLQFTDNLLKAPAKCNADNIKVSCLPYY